MTSPDETTPIYATEHTASNPPVAAPRKFFGVTTFGSPTPVALSWSGGKDSALTLAALRADPSVDVVALLTSVTLAYDRISIHGVRRSLLRAQAQAAGIPLHEIVIEANSSNEQYDLAMAGALTALREAHPALTTVAYGDLFLEDVRRYREERLGSLGFVGSFPIWGRPTRELAESFLDHGFEARLVCVDTTQLDASFAGRTFDHSLLADLPARVDPCGERGEFHTFVSNGPMFDAPVAYATGDVVLRDDRFAYCDLLPAD
jgi:uncharacterized protein (TIGR00290 family)